MRKAIQKWLAKDSLIGPFVEMICDVYSQWKSELKIICNIYI